MATKPAPITKDFKCPECGITHTWERSAGTRSRASYGKFHKLSIKDGDLYGWATSECKGESAKNGRLYVEHN